MRKKITAGMLLVLFAVLSACKGGGEAPSKQEAPREETVLTWDVIVDQDDAAELLPADTADVYPVTIVTRSKDSSGWIHRYENRELDFNGLSLGVLSCDLSGKGPALELQLRLPEGWDEELSRYMAEDGLQLSFLTDGMPADLFRERTVVRDTSGNSWRIRYQTCIRPDEVRSAAELNIVPYFDRYDTIEESRVTNGERRKYMLKDGQAFSAVYEGTKAAKNKTYINTVTFERVMLERYAAVIKGSGSGGQMPSPMTLSFMEELWDENQKNGVYEVGDLKDPKRSVYLEEKDLSRVRFVLDEFHILEEEIKLGFSLYLPEDWTEEQCRSLYQTGCLNIVVRVDGAVNGKDGLFFGVDGMSFAHSAANHGVGVSYETRNISQRVTHFVNWNSRLTPEEWKTKKTLTITPQIKLTASVPEGTLSKEPFISTQSNFGEGKLIELEELTITVEITPDLFESGY